MTWDHMSSSGYHGCKWSSSSKRLPRTTSDGSAENNNDDDDNNLWAAAAAADPSRDGMTGARESRGRLREHIERL